MDRLIRLSRFVAGGIGALMLLAACTGPEVGETFAHACPQAGARQVMSEASLSAALAQQAAANHRYVECVGRKGVHVGVGAVAKR